MDRTGSLLKKGDGAGNHRSLYFLMFQYKDDIILPQCLPMYIPTDAASRRKNRIESTTLEDRLVDCLRRCWNDPMYRRGISVSGKDHRVLKRHIHALRVFRRNREINPELHAQLDRECVEKYREAWTVTTPKEKEAWRIHCRNEALLTTQIWDESVAETGLLEVDGEQINLFGETEPKPVEKDKPIGIPTEKVSIEYIRSCIVEIEKGKFPEYMPVRETAMQFTGNTQKDFLRRSIQLAKTQMQETKIGGRFNQERVIRVASNMLAELHRSRQNEITFDF